MVTKVNPSKSSKPAKTTEAAAKQTHKRTGFKVSTEAYKTSMPENFNFADYKPLKKKNFETDELYFLHRAEEMKHKASTFLRRAAEAKAAGTNRATAGKAKRMIKLTEKMAELRKQLEEQGIDVESILATAAKA
jgi:hypothetical protein